jgi:Zn-dependent M16 (insulinase) family peptidase
MYKPLLREIDFQQEGWRLDLQEKPIIKGVVFNEMKGVY